RANRRSPRSRRTRPSAPSRTPRGSSSSDAFAAAKGASVRSVRGASSEHHGLSDAGFARGDGTAASTSSRQAKNFARSKSNLRLLDGNELLELIQAHYDQFDGRYRALLPLRRVLIPGPVGQEE